MPRIGSAEKAYIESLKSGLRNTCNAQEKG
jgi:hypothetical protein